MNNPVLIGNATLHLGDCLEILPTLPKADAVITDPPYGIKAKFGESKLYGTRKMQFHFDTDSVTEEVVIPALSLAFLLVKSFHLFLDPEQFSGIAKVARALGFTPKPFAKIKACPPPPMPGNWWPSGFELAMYGYRSGAYFGDQSAKRVNLITADAYRHGIRANEKVDHPTQKWLPMINYLVQSIVPIGGTALDPFMGSGTTGVACVTSGRKFIGCEIDPAYFDIACRRIEKAQQQQRMEFDVA